MKSLVGIDVSKWQGVVDWASVVRAGCAFAFAKATHGASGVDSSFERNRAGIRGAGLSFGAYHWFLPSHDPIAQARHFVATVGALEDGDVGLAIDFEDDEKGTYKGARLLAPLLACAREVTALTRRRPLIYTGRWFVAGSVGIDSDELASYPLWHAQYPRTAPDTRPYGEAVAALPDDPAIADVWAKRGIHEVIWQFDGDGGLRLPNGVDVDVNRFRGDDLREFIEWTRVLPDTLRPVAQLEAEADPRGAAPRDAADLIAELFPHTEAANDNADDVA